MAQIEITDTAENIVDQARSWIGTRFRHQGRKKKSKGQEGAVDCIGLVVGVAKELSLMSKQGQALTLASFDEKDYPREPQRHRLASVMASHLEIIPKEEIKAGDIALFNMAKYPQHVGFVAHIKKGELSIIHAYHPVGKVCEHRFCDKWLKRLDSAYRFKHLSGA